MLTKFLSSDKEWNDWKQLRWSLWVTFQSEWDITLIPEIFGEKCTKGTLIGYSDQLAFCHFPHKFEGKRGDKITKKSIKTLLNQSQSWTLGRQLADKQYLVMIFHSSSAEILVGVDISNKQHPKITTTLIDTKWYLDDDGISIYRNRTFEGQCKQLTSFTQWGARSLTLRAIKEFFEKEALTKDFYSIYKTQLFDKIKKDLIRRHGKSDEDAVNNFILINLNRLLFIHFLDRKWGVFPEYDAKRWSYISYLFHDIYKNSWSDKSFYDAILRPLFFDVFNKAQIDRPIAQTPYLFDNFNELPYLNGGLFKESDEEKAYNMIIDNVFVKTFITQIIDKYNFTITEDTPQEVSIAVDPELLGYIFENLIQEYDAEQLAKKSAKKKAKKDNQRSKGGIFYTPKVEVDFMCRQVLIEWLAKDPELQNNKKDLYELFYPEQGGSSRTKKWKFFSDADTENFWTHRIYQRGWSCLWIRGIPCRNDASDIRCRKYTLRN